MAFTMTLGSVDLASSPYNVTDYDPGYPDLTEAGQSRALAGLPLSDEHYGYRHFTMEIKLVQSSKALRNSSYRSIVAEIMPSASSANNTNTLTYNAGAGSNVTFTFYRGASTVSCINQVPGDSGPQPVYYITLDLLCQPFARGAQVDLPRNYVVDSKLWEDFDDDGIANSLTNFDSGTPPTHTNSIDGGQKIDVTACTDTNQYAGLSQTITDIDGTEVWSYRIEYKCTAATNCFYTISVLYNDGGATVHTLLNQRTAVQSDWTEAKLENQTVPAGATQAIIRFYVQSTAAAGAVGTLWTRKAMAVEDTALPTGADGGTLWYESEVAETPSVFRVDNMPGDAEALARLEWAANAGSTDGRILARRRRGATGTPLVVDTFTRGSDTALASPGAHGGKFWRLNAVGANLYNTCTIPSSARGIYQCYVRTRSSAGTPSGDTLTLDITYGASWTGDDISLTAATSVWEVVYLGTFDFPPFDYPDTADALDMGIRITYGGEAGAIDWDLDFLVLVPVDQDYVISPVHANVNYAIESDSISSPIGVYTTGTDASSPTWPAASPSTMTKEIYSGAPMKLNPGTNEMVMFNYYTTTPTNVRAGKLSISYIPRYLLVQ